MAVHSTGTGSGWLETLDVDQPHGLTYREFNDFRIGIRKRFSQQHTAPADATAGGLHKPGKTSILLTDTTANLATYLADSSCAEFALACSTLTGRIFYMNDATNEWIKLPLQSASFCMGGDFTWTGGHEFDASVRFDGTATFADGAEFSGAVRIQGSFCSIGTLYVDGTVDFTGTVTFDNSIQVKGQAEFTAGVVFDDSVAVTGALVCASNANVTGDFSGTGTMMDRIVKAWASFCGSGGFTLVDNYNIASGQKVAEGDYSLLFTTALADANYAVVAMVKDQSVNVAADLLVPMCYSQKTTGFEIKVGKSGGNLLDVSRVSVVVFGG